MKHRFHFQIDLGRYAGALDDVHELGIVRSVSVLRLQSHPLRVTLSHANQGVFKAWYNLTPADVYFGRGQTILLERERIKRITIEHRRLQHQKSVA